MELVYKNKSSYIKIFLSLFLMVLSIILISWGPYLLGGILALLVLVVVSLILSNCELMHPLTWFPPIFFLYSISTAVLELSNEVVYGKELEYVLFLEWVALFTFIVILALPIKVNKEYNFNTVNNINIVMGPILLISTVLSSAYLGYIYINGLSSKYSIALDQSAFSSFHIFFSIYVISSLVLFSMKIIKEKKIPKMYLLVTSFFAFIILAVAGERDILLRLIVGYIFLIHFFYKKIKIKTLFTVGILGVLSIPILDNMKNLIFGERDFSNESFIYSIFGGEFRSAPFNIFTLVTNPEKWTYFKGETLIWDLKISTFFNSLSPGAWFNQTFFSNIVERGGGYGFSIVGEGYINFGVIGVIVWFILLAGILRFLFIKANTGYLWSLIYIALIPIIIYAIRGDFATILTHFNKHIALPLIIVYIFKTIIENRKLGFGNRYNKYSINSK